MTEVLQVAKTRYADRRCDDMQVTAFLKMLAVIWFIYGSIETNRTRESMQVIQVVKVI